MEKPLFILNGANLNMLGQREPELYGEITLSHIEALCHERATHHQATLDFRQTNHEGILIDWVQEAHEKASALIINAGAFTHTSVALLDALKMLSMPVIELHLTIPMQRESFRHHSYITPGATGILCGLGANGYVLAIDAAIQQLKNAV